MESKIKGEVVDFVVKVRRAVTPAAAARVVWSASGLLAPQYCGNQVLLRDVLGGGRVAATVPNAGAFRAELNRLQEAAHAQ